MSSFFQPTLLLLGPHGESHLLALLGWEGSGEAPTCCPAYLQPAVGGFAGSIKAGRRRSSYLLAITTERSKSCDDGLNTFREEGRALR